MNRPGHRGTIAIGLTYSTLEEGWGGGFSTRFLGKVAETARGQGRKEKDFCGKKNTPKLREIRGKEKVRSRAEKEKVQYITSLLMGGPIWESAKGVNWTC